LFFIVYFFINFQRDFYNDTLVVGMKKASLKTPCPKPFFTPFYIFFEPYKKFRIWKKLSQSKYYNAM